jgi:hypothetical protein
MFKYLWKKIKGALMDEEEGKILWGVISRSFIMWVGTMSGIVIVSAPDLDAVLAWGWKGWAARLGPAGLMAFALLIRGGDKNRTPEQVVASLQAAGYKLEKAP